MLRTLSGAWGGACFLRPRVLPSFRLDMQRNHSAFSVPLFLPPYLHASTSLRLQRASRAPELYTSISLRLQHASRHRYLHVPTRTARPPTSRPPYFHTSVSRRLLEGPTASIATSYNLAERDIL